MSGHSHEEQLAKDQRLVARTHNTARFFTEHRHVAWVLLLGTVLWGVLSYRAMPQRKDPDIPVREAVAICPWPGASVEKIENLVTRRIEQKMAENSKVVEVRSTTRTGVAFVYVKLADDAADTGKQLDDIRLKLDSLRNLPEGAGPVNFIKDFGDTAALMLTVASPQVSETEIDLRARDIAAAITAARRGAPGTRVALLANLPRSLPAEAINYTLSLFVEFMAESGLARDIRPLNGPGFAGIDAATDADDAALFAGIARFYATKVRSEELHPDAWQPTIVRDVAGTRDAIARVAGDKYTYRELEDFSELLVRNLQRVPSVAKVTRSGVLPERVLLDYSQARLAAYGLQSTRLAEILRARNITTSGGVLEAKGKSIAVDPTGEFKSEKDIGDVIVGASPSGAPVYLRDLAIIVRTYESPPRFLNFYGRFDEKGRWQRSRAVTIAVQMRSGEQIAAFGKAVDAALDDVKTRLPEDLVLARTSDQPLQVKENVDLFMKSLYEAIALVVLVSLIGFWEWRSALLMALSIPITLAMTFGLMALVGIDLQQVSIASLIIALGLLVDDPVVAGDAIKRDLAMGHPPVVAAWLGPTKLATAILYATVTNIVAYLPFLLLPGDTGRFLYSLPVVIGCSLVASRLVSMTFIPLLGYYLLRPTVEKSIEERRRSGFASFYYRTGTWAIAHRKLVLAASFLLLALGGVFAKQLKQQFFPNDLSYLSYVDVWLPEDAPLSATREAEARVVAVIRKTADEYGKAHPGERGKPREVLHSLTSFVGGGGPRFWFSVAPELSQPNYAQVLVQVNDKHDTNHLVGPLQDALTAAVPGARVDVRRLESGAPVGIPVSIRVSGEDGPTLRRLAGELEAILREAPAAVRVRNDWVGSPGTELEFAL